MPTLTLNQNYIKGVHNGKLALEIPLRILRKILDLQASSRTKQTDDVWEKARGIWKNKNIDPVKYQRQLRNEWS